MMIAHLLLAALSFDATAALAAGDQGASGKRMNVVVRIMTQNMNQGTAFEGLLAPQSPEEFVAAATATYRQILATDPAARAAAMARQIAQLTPDLVGLQEAAILRTGNTAPATIVQFDLAQLLIRELERLGHPYHLAAIVPGFDAQAPTSLGFDMRLTTQNAIIARADAELQLSNVQVQQFQAKLTVPLPGVGITITEPRGWASVDVRIRDRAFRFVTTHLESVPPIGAPLAEDLLGIQMAQAQNLVAAAGDTPLPVIFAGDFNAVASDAADPTFRTYARLRAAGLSDAWNAVGHRDPGFTCCQAPEGRKAVSSLSERTDLVLLRGVLRVIGAELVGERPSDRTPSGRWPSDHAGVAVTLELPSGR
jgi:endonuclease/exonuclease/phosphatase family metal-dependent hydrolase